ncbi:hypothetical protein ACH5RR_036536 [Cinchona calisaya]|uniref:Uncharacterized protein n=1 Tax=Cinchona calisaya TaxID=153742 RepID=A0ABD2Y4X4_9GENT
MVRAAWIQVPELVNSAVETLGYSFRGGLHAAGHAFLNVVLLLDNVVLACLIVLLAASIMRFYTRMLPS